MSMLGNMNAQEMEALLGYMTQHERLEWQRTLSGSINVADFRTFKQRIDPNYEQLPLHDLLDEKLMGVMEYVKTGGRSGIPRLMISVPPRHGKTRTSAELFPAYALGIMPTLKMISTSYSAELAQASSRSVINIIDTPIYREMFQDIRISEDKSSPKEWTLEYPYRGGIKTAGVRGGVTGFGAGLIIIDDTVKNREQANNAHIMRTIYQWYQETLYTRLEQPGGAIIIIMTRWSHDDLVGRLLEDMRTDPTSDKWEYIRIPALAEEDDPLGRKQGEALWESRYSAEYLLSYKRRNPFNFMANYQQLAKKSEGTSIKTEALTIVPVEPSDIEETVRYWDLAQVKKAKADYTVGARVSKRESGRLFIADIFRDRLDTPEIIKAIKEYARMDGYDVPQIIEADANGRAVYQLLKVDIEMAMYDIRLKEIPRDIPKETRIARFIDWVNGNLVEMYLGDWNESFIEEGLYYGTSQRAHDDQLDACAGALFVMVEGVNKEGGTMRNLWNRMRR